MEMTLAPSVAKLQYYSFIYLFIFPFNTEFRASYIPTRFSVAPAKCLTSWEHFFYVHICPPKTKRGGETALISLGGALFKFVSIAVIME